MSVATLPQSPTAYVADFEAGRIAPEDFHHCDHVRLAWSYLRCCSVPETLDRIRHGIQHFATNAGEPDLYHETITWAYVFAIRERMQAGIAANFEAFAAANPDLFEWPSPLIEGLYSRERLASGLARRSFLLPDRGPCRSSG